MPPVSAPAALNFITASAMTSLAGAADFKPSSGPPAEAWMVLAFAGGSTINFTDGVNSTVGANLSSGAMAGGYVLITDLVYGHSSGAEYISAGKFSDYANVKSALVNGGATLQPASGEAWLVTFLQGGTPRLTDGTNEFSVSVSAGVGPTGGLTNAFQVPGFVITNGVYLKNNAVAGTYMFVSALRLQSKSAQGHFDKPLAVDQLNVSANPATKQPASGLWLLTYFTINITGTLSLQITNGTTARIYATGSVPNAINLAPCFIDNTLYFQGGTGGSPARAFGGLIQVA